jgi:hypothetical protein
VQSLDWERIGISYIDFSFDPSLEFKVFLQTISQIPVEPVIRWLLHKPQNFTVV